MKQFVVTLILSSYIFAGSFSLEPAKTFDTNITTKHGWCSYSGENLLKTYKTNVLVTLSDKMVKQYASMRFFAQDYDSIKDRIQTIQVVDAKSTKFIDAGDAYFVLNSTLSSPFSKYLKIAFKNKSDAREFISNYGGDIRDFDFTFYMADRDLELDKDFTKAKDQREVKRGKKVYESMCSEIKAYDYISLVNMKKTIKNLNLCKNLNEKNLQAVSKYLWDASTFQDQLAQSSRIEVPQKAKCPVCGMFVAKYPKWVGKIILKGGETYYFDGAKDMFKYYFQPQRYHKNHTQKDIVKLEVTNYYTLESIDAKKAFYVLGSNVYGPMGHELIPFTNAEEAFNFKKTRFGKEILMFDEITLQKVFALDN